VGRVSVLFMALVCVAAFASVAGASALLVQDTNPWVLSSNQDDMTALGISYAMSDYASVDWNSLCFYDFVLLCGSDGNDMAYRNYALPNLAQLDSFVSSGGLLLIHYADWDSYTGVIAPGGVSTNSHVVDNLDIDPGYVGDPLVNNVTNASLDGWIWSTHAYLSNLLPGTETPIVCEDGSGPAYVRYGIGAGEVWLTGMTLEWVYNNADPDVLWNELSMAGQWDNPNRCVPEPASIISLCAGLALLAGSKLRKRS